MREMQWRRRGDADRVDLAEQLAKIGEPADNRFRPRLSAALLVAGVDHGDEFGAGQRGILLGVESAEVTDADDGCPYFLHDDCPRLPRSSPDDTQWRLLRRV